jgi:hypothetical protein
MRQPMNLYNFPVFPAAAECTVPVNVSQQSHGHQVMQSFICK